MKQVKARAMERALLQEDCECGQMESGGHAHKPEWVSLADDANEATRLLNVKCTRGWTLRIASLFAAMCSWVSCSGLLAAAAHEKTHDPL